ncbi:unnamed protein product [Rhizophagus irregularis]|nr:unnamed protein product [Rhizophagus irregularis]
MADETICERFLETLEYSADIWPLPSDTCKHELGRSLPTVELLCKASHQESDARETKGMAHTETEDLWPELQLLYTRETTSISDINVEPRAREGCGIEGEKYEDIPRSEYCRNRTGLDAIPLALGQLLRISPVGSSIKWPSCKFVFPHITFTLEMMEVKDLCLKPLGESQLFTNDMMSGVLWPLGDTLEEARTRSWTFEVSWVVDEETGTVYEVERYRGTRKIKTPENQEIP